MKGLELARAYWETARPILESQYPDLMARAAVGLCGAGSDCLGYDDELSHDHAYAPGFMIWLPEQDYVNRSFALSTAYDKLPREFCGMESEHKSREGSGRYGVFSCERFFRGLIGSPGVPERWQTWLYTPSHYFAAAVSGEVFSDQTGEFTAIREGVRTGMPEDVRLKKMAARAALMAQSGQYNYKRCLNHGEPFAARLAADEFVRESLGMLFLLNRRFMPHYKWMLRAARELPILPELVPILEQILESPSEELFEQSSAMVIAELRREGLTDGAWDYLEPHAYEISKHIQLPEIAALHVMEG